MFWKLENSTPKNSWHTLLIVQKSERRHQYFYIYFCEWLSSCQWLGLTLILLTWKIGWAPNNARKWQMGFNLAFKWFKMTQCTLFHNYLWVGLCHKFFPPVLILFHVFMFSLLRLLLHNVCLNHLKYATFLNHVQ
jgi:hypothetical protein